jgi:hypothetical protein
LLLLVGLAAGIGIAYWVGNKMATKEAEQAIEQLVAENEEIESLQYGGLKVGLLDQGGRISDIQLRLKGVDDPIKIDQIQVADLAQAKGRWVQADVRMEGLTLKNDHDLLESFTPDLAAMGYKEVVMDASLAYRYDLEERLLQVEEMRLHCKDMGTISMAATLAQVNALGDINKKDLDLGSLFFSFSLVSIGPSKLEYEDHSLFQKWIKQEAKKSGRQPKELVAKWHKQLDEAANPDDHMIVKNARKAVKAFLANPDRITAQIDPEKPVALMRFILESWDRLMENLQLKIETG